MCCNCNSNNLNRREFLEVSALGIAGAGLGLSSFTTDTIQEWNPGTDIKFSGKTLRVQPVLLYEIYKRRPATSWRPWGGLHTEEDAKAEVNRISNELSEIVKRIDNLTEHIETVCDAQNYPTMMSLLKGNSHE